MAEGTLGSGRKRQIEFSTLERSSESGLAREVDLPHFSRLAGAAAPLTWNS